MPLVAPEGPLQVLEVLGRELVSESLSVPLDLEGEGPEVSVDLVIQAGWQARVLLLPQLGPDLPFLLHHFRGVSSQ